MYYKGALLLNTIRSVVNDDKKWWKLILDYSLHFRHNIIDTKMVIAFFNKETGTDLSPIFNQYLNYKNIPVLEFQKKGNKMQFRWKTDVANFNMPIDVIYKGVNLRLNPKNEWQLFPKKIKSLNELEVLTDKFLVDVNVK
jgi:aminopeptidase N